MIINRRKIWNLHAHSQFSAQDALPEVKDMVATVKSYGHPALGLTDHGNMAGSVQLYKNCSEVGIKPFPGTELYVVHNREDKKAKRHHMCVVAYTTQGYVNLVNLNNLANTNFYNKPLIDHSDMAELSEAGLLKGIAATSGCYFGYIAQAIDNDDRMSAMLFMQGYQTWFDKFYVELQNHNITHDNGMTDDSLADQLMDCANNLGIPCILTQDSHYCNTPDAPIWMYDLTHKPLGEIVPGDEVMGWERQSSYRQFVKSVVISVNRRDAEIFEITMKSGKKIKCTSDHQWVDARKWRSKFYDGYPYSSPFNGMKLVQMIEPKDYSLVDQHTAGWLGGMYDGEGSRLGIAQSYSHNPNVCDKIERSFGELGIEYTVGTNSGSCNIYRIVGGRQGYVDFINSCKPERDEWLRSRVIGKWASLLREDEIVDIRSIGVGEVVSMETTSGNYVAWGYASKNCHQDEKPVHETMKRLVSFGPDADDAVFPGDGFHLGDSEWFATHHHKVRYDCGADGLEDLLSAHTLEIPELDNYKYNIPFTVEDPDAELGRLCVTEYGERNLSDRYLERLEDELQIVRDTGMAGYLLLVAQVTDWCRANRVFYQARGSASGSILCWLLGITQVDPLKHKLRFERFISRDRTKPPDIDLDVEFKRRQELIEWLESRFSVHQIGTWLQLSLHGDDDSSKGSIRVKYYAKARGAGNPIHEWKDVPPEDKKELYALGDSSAYSAYGVHPAGLVVTTNDAQFNKLVPMMKVASSKTYVTQYGMNDVEALGLVKLDILGLKTLSILHQCMDNLGRDVFDGLDWIPNADPAVYRMIAKGDTDGVFQLEGWAAKTGCMSLKPTKLGDVIASMALFRPATMQSGATESYIRRKHKQERIPTRHALIDSHTKETYGIMLYQEQVIAILRDLGMDPDNLTKFLKAVKASNSSVGDASGVIAGYESRLKSLADSHGMSEADWKWLWTAIEGFAAYGFNKAHATAYGLTAYRCAYLAHHHPVQFFAAVLAIHAGTEKEKQYVKAARYKGLSIRRPDVNKSGVTYAVDPRGKAIRKGLVAIKGLGVKSAELIVDKRPEGGYTSIEDMCRTVGSRVSGAKAFIETGSTDVGVIGKLKEEKAFVSLDDEEETI